MLAVSYGYFVLGNGVSFWQGLLAGVLGIVVSFLFVGLVALAGKRGSAPTMVLSRAAFGVVGNALPSAVSYLLLVGWEIILVSLSTKAVATVFEQLGWAHGTGVKVIAFLVVIAVIVLAGIKGFDAILRLQTWLTIVLAAATVGYILLTLDHVHWHTVSAIPSGSFTGILGAAVTTGAAFGLGWVNAGADYSRYLPRSASSRGVVFWTTFGASVAPIVLLAYGLLLVGSSKALSDAISVDPIGALAAILPTWYLIPFVVVAVGGLISGAILDIYSSGLTLLTLGLRIPRWQAAAIDGVLMIIGSIYVVFRAPNFFGPVPGVPDHPRRTHRRLVWRLPGRPGVAQARLRPGGALRRSWPLRLGRLGGRRLDAARHGAGLGSGDRLLQRLHLGGLPVRAVRAGRQERLLGLHRPRRPGRAGRRLRRTAILSRGTVRAQESSLTEAGSGPIRSASRTLAGSELDGGGYDVLAQLDGGVRRRVQDELGQTRAARPRRRTGRPRRRRCSASRPRDAARSTVRPTARASRPAGRRPAPPG